jgi:mannosyltransferase OCH1-like enzyme
MSKIFKNTVYDIKPQKINVNNTLFPNKKLDEYNIVVPPNIFQTWHTKQLPPMMFKSIQQIKKNNPRFNYFLFDDNDCREFIKNNFSQDILNAYDSLIPGAYKADLWRYCVLYKFGGIYLDIKYIPVNGFKFINLLEQEHWPLDINKKNIYNALLICKPRNEILLKAINQIVENVKNKYYGMCYLSPTGPELLSRFFTEDDKENFRIYHELSGNNDFDKIIKFHNYIILRCYPGYFKERDIYAKKSHYSILWNNRNIYL